MVAMTTATPMRQKMPSKVRPHCAAISSFVPGPGLARVGRRAAAPVQWWGCVAITQASLLAQALHEVFINGLRDGAVQHEISLRREAGPLYGRGRIKKASALASRRNQRRERSECASRSGRETVGCFAAAPSRKSAGPACGLSVAALHCQGPHPAGTLS